MSDQTETALSHARALHQRCVVLDAHVDTTQMLMREGWNFAQRHRDGHVDLPRLREGGVSAVVPAVWAPTTVVAREAVKAARAQLTAIHDAIARHPNDLLLARSAEDVRQARSTGRIAMLPAIEGGHLIAQSLDLLREYRAAGAVYMTLTHSAHHDWADSSGGDEPATPRHHGLTPFGREVIREMNRLGMMVDVSHAGDATFWAALETSAAPVVATHSCCLALAPHHRNLTDDMLRALAATGGCVGICFYAAFVDRDFPRLERSAMDAYFAAGLPRAARLTAHRTPMDLCVAHVLHALDVAGPEHVALGSDFDGAPVMPIGLEDCAGLPRLTAALLERGVSESTLELILGENFLRVMDRCASHALTASSGAGFTNISGAVS